MARLKAGLRVSVCAFAVAGLAGNALAADIDTNPSWSGTAGYAWNCNAQDAVGQVITPDATQTNLSSFTIQLTSLGAVQNYQAYVYAWDNTNRLITGSALYSSTVLVSPATAYSTFSPTTYDTAGISLSAGQTYMLFVTTAGQANCSGAAGVGGIVGNDAPYADGSAFAMSSIGSFATLSGSSWVAANSDLAFAASFSHAITPGIWQSSSLGGAIVPDFQGGTLQMSSTSTITRAFNVGAVAGNTIDAKGFTGTFSGVFSGTGGLTITSSVAGGNIIFSGNNSYTGATNVSSGTLTVNGSLASTVTVSGTGVLKGNGRIANVTLGSGGAIAPGNSIGTANVTNLGFASGSTYQAEVNADGRSDLINASGTVTIASGATLSVLPEAGSYGPVTSYTIINATGGVSGGFGTVTSSAANLLPGVSYSANQVRLTLVRTDVQFGNYGLTANQKAAGQAVTAGGAGALYVKAAIGGATTENSFYSTLGARLTLQPIPLGGGAEMIPRFDFGWQKALNVFRPWQGMTFISTGSRFNIAGLTAANDAFSLAAGMDVAVIDGAVIHIGYNGVLAGSGQLHTCSIGLDWAL